MDCINNCVVIGRNIGKRTRKEPKEDNELLANKVSRQDGSPSLLASFPPFHPPSPNQAIIIDPKAELMIELDRCKEKYKLATAEYLTVLHTLTEDLYKESLEKMEQVSKKYANCLVVHKPECSCSCSSSSSCGPEQK